MTLDSIVTWTLTEKAGGTELLLEQTGFKGIKSYINYLMMDKGWSLVIRKRLIQLLKKMKNEAVNP